MEYAGDCDVVRTEQNLLLVSFITQSGSFPFLTSVHLGSTHSRISRSESSFLKSMINSLLIRIWGRKNSDLPTWEKAASL